VRISRACYDKPRRCPGWAGGGLHYAKVDRCDDGYLRGWDEPGRARWPTRCPKCKVWVLPYATRWMDPSWWVLWVVPDRYRAVRDWLSR
jgi:hypothetical protein